MVADILRFVAFLGIGLVDGFPATLALALVAGMGTGLFNPASLAAIPSLVARERMPAATALYGAITDLGFTRALPSPHCSPQAGPEDHPVRQCA